MRYTILATILLTAACGHNPKINLPNPFKNADGSVNVPAIINAVEFGIKADCSLPVSPLSQDICTFGQDAVDAARAAVGHDPVAGAAAAAKAIQDSEGKVPAVKLVQLKPYLDWAVNLLLQVK